MSYFTYTISYIHRRAPKTILGAQNLREKILIYEGLTPSYFKYVTFQSLLFHSELNNVRVSYV